MLESRDKISTRQAIIFFIAAQSSPVIRIMPKHAAEIVGRAGWVAPLLSVLPFICLVYVMQMIFKKQRNASLGELYIKVFGSFIGRTILAFYLIWSMILMGLYLRYFAERFLSSLLPNTIPAFFYITMLIAVFYAVKGGIVNLARTVGFLFYLFVVVFITLFLCSLPNVQKINLLPVTRYDIIPMVKTIKSLFGVWGYFSLVFFFGDKINDKEHIRKLGLHTVIFNTLTSIMLLVQTIGVYGHTVIGRIPLPYFESIKSITLLETIERIESVALAFWVFIDFTVISLFLYLSICIIKNLFSLSEAKYFASPIALFAFIFAYYLGNNRLELEQFTDYIGLPVNVFLCFIMPVILLAIGKIRKVI